MQEISHESSELRLKTCVLQALRNLGVSESYLISTMTTYNHKSALNRRGVLNFQNISVSDWIWLCEFLYMPIDPIADEWMRAYQRNHACAAILEGRFILPMTEEVRILLGEFLRQEKTSIRFNKKQYGSPLLERVIAERRKEVKGRRMMRLQNRIRMATTKNAFQSLSTNGQGFQTIHSFCP